MFCVQVVSFLSLKKSSLRLVFPSLLIIGIAVSVAGCSTVGRLHPAPAKASCHKAHILGFKRI